MSGTKIYQSEFDKPPYLRKITNDDIHQLNEYASLCVKHKYTDEVYSVSEGSPGLGLVSILDVNGTPWTLEVNDLKKHYMVYNQARVSLDSMGYRLATGPENCGKCSWMHEQRCSRCAAMIYMHYTCDDWKQS